MFSNETPHSLNCNRWLPKVAKCTSGRLPRAVSTDRWLCLYDKHNHRPLLQNESQVAAFIPLGHDYPFRDAQLHYFNHQACSREWNAHRWPVGDLSLSSVHLLAGIKPADSLNEKLLKFQDIMRTLDICCFCFWCGITQTGTSPSSQRQYRMHFSHFFGLIQHFEKEHSHTHRTSGVWGGFCNSLGVPLPSNRPPGPRSDVVDFTAFFQSNEQNIKEETAMRPLDRHVEAKVTAAINAFEN